jgi:hypothetical protein
MSDSNKTALEFKEQTAMATLEQAQAAYDLACDRVFKLLPVLVAGASAIGIFGLGALQTRPTLAVSLILAALWISSVAALAVLRGAKSNQVTAGSNAAAIEARFQQHLATFNGDVAQALTQTRVDQLAAVDLQIDAYSKLASARSTVLDGTYKALVFGTPSAFIVGYVSACMLERYC